MTRFHRAVIAILGVLLGLLLGACSKGVKGGEPIAFRELAVGYDGLNDSNPRACARKNEGKVFAVDGFPQWTQSGELCSGDDCTLWIYEQNKPDGTPLSRADLPSAQQPGHNGNIRLAVAKKGALGGFVDPPKYKSSSSSVKGGTIGSIERDSLGLHLSDGTVVNNRTRVKLFVKVSDVNGACDVRYVGGAKL